MGENTWLYTLSQQLTINKVELTTIANDFRKEMQNGLEGKASSLKMLPTHLGRPTGSERGAFLAVDFGGTNVRVLAAELAGEGQYTIKHQLSVPLTGGAGTPDYTAHTTNADTLFDFLANQIGQLASPSLKYRLGHTFSFPCRQTSVNHSILLHWTKEIATSGVEGQDVGCLLDKALLRQGVTNVKPVVILNDTVGTLITSAYADNATDIGSICGTGHNTCYLEPLPPLGNKPMIINMESGNFDLLPLTRYDLLLDADSQRPGEQRLEKMVSGRYIGELVRLIAQEVINIPILPYGLKSEDISLFLADTTPDLTKIEHLLAEKFNCATTHLNRANLQTLSRLVVHRSARLAAATYVGVLWHLDMKMQHNHTIAIDGSLYEKMPGYAGHLQDALVEVTGSDAAKIHVRLIKDGSGIGAAIAAAIAAKP